MRYDLSRVMTKAWKIYRQNKEKGISFAEAKKAANITEPVNTWARWKELGFEVIHGSKALFSTVLIWGSRGDDATYKASFFGGSQVQPI